MEGGFKKLIESKIEAHPEVDGESCTKKVMYNLKKMGILTIQNMACYGEAHGAGKDDFACIRQELMSCTKFKFEKEEITVVHEIWSRAREYFDDKKKMAEQNAAKKGTPSDSNKSVKVPTGDIPIAEYAKLKKDNPIRARKEPQKKLVSSIWNHKNLGLFPDAIPLTDMVRKQIVFLKKKRSFQIVEVMSKI